MILITPCEGRDKWLNPRYIQEVREHEHNDLVEIVMHDAEVIFTKEHIDSLISRIWGSERV